MDWCVEKSEYVEKWETGMGRQGMVSKGPAQEELAYGEQICLQIGMSNEL